MKHNGTTNMRCGTKQHIPTNQVKFNLLNWPTVGLAIWRMHAQLFGANSGFLIKF